MLVHGSDDRGWISRQVSQSPTPACRCYEPATVLAATDARPEGGWPVLTEGAHGAACASALIRKGVHEICVKPGQAGRLVVSGNRHQLANEASPGLQFVRPHAQ